MSHSGGQGARRGHRCLAGRPERGGGGGDVGYI